MRISDWSSDVCSSDLEAMSLPQKDIEAFLRKVPFNAEGRRRFEAPRVDVPTALPVPSGDVMSTQEAFGTILNEIARDKSPLAARIVTTSPDVTVSTHPGPWVTRRGIFEREQPADTFSDQQVPSEHKWVLQQEGQNSTSKERRV